MRVSTEYRPAPKIRTMSEAKHKTVELEMKPVERNMQEIVNFILDVGRLKAVTCGERTEGLRNDERIFN